MQVLKRSVSCQGQELWPYQRQIETLGHLQCGILRLRFPLCLCRFRDESLLEYVLLQYGGIHNLHEAYTLLKCSAPSSIFTTGLQLAAETAHTHH